MHKLLFCPRIEGHRIEYINHLYCGAVNDSKNDYILAVPKSFDQRKAIYSWPNGTNIKLVYLDTKYILPIKGNIIKQSHEKCRRLGDFLKEYNIDEVLLLDMIDYVPFLPLCVKKKVKVSGIIYRIYTYDYQNEGFAKKCMDRLKYIVMSHFEVYHKVYILNALEAVNTLNRLYSTTKFTYLPDPVVAIKHVADVDIRKKYFIPEDRKIILHPGGMLDYKGTIEILQAIALLDDKMKEKFTFIFAGVITKGIRDKFYSLYNDLKESVQLIVIEDFLSLDLLGRLFMDCNYVLIPYKINSQSSGIIGHAAFFKRPVIVVRGGVIGNLVEKYKLGLLLDSFSPEAIKSMLEDIPNFDNGNNTYATDHTIDAFVHVILNL